MGYDRRSCAAALAQAGGQLRAAADLLATGYEAPPEGVPPEPKAGPPLGNGNELHSWVVRPSWEDWRRLDARFGQRDGLGEAIPKKNLAPEVQCAALNFKFTPT